MKSLARNWKTLFTVCLIFGLVGCTFERKKPCDTLPEGWTIVTDGTVYRFRFPNGATSLFDKDTKEAAIEAACGQKLHGDREKETNWKEAN